MEPIPNSTQLFILRNFEKGSVVYFASDRGFTFKAVIFSKLLVIENFSLYLVPNVVCSHRMANV